MIKILSVKNLSVILDGETIIDSIDFELDKNDTLAIIGPNGSGKTVLIRTLLGMLPHQGKIEWSKNIRLGYVPQKIDADRHLPMNLRDLLTAKAHALKLEEIEIEKTIEAVGVDENIMNTPIGHLSGGQFQKALLAFALLGRPNVLILDEPTASIDQPREREVFELLHRLQDKFGLTLILVSHDLSVVYKSANKVFCLNKENICYGAPTEVLTPETLEKLYGVPNKFYHHIHKEELK